jgi:hypothetical protein
VRSIGVSGLLSPGQHEVRYSATYDENHLASDDGVRSLVAVFIGG